MRPPLHGTWYGDSGTGKSTLAATGPKPMLILCWDGYGNDRPYTDLVLTPQGLWWPRWLVQEEEVQGECQTSGVEFDKSLGLYYQHVLNGDELLVRLEYYHDSDGESTAPAVFRTRMADFHKEYESWATVVEDSITWHEISARMEWNETNEGKNRPSRDLRAGFGSSANDLERFIWRLRGWPMNTIVIAHTRGVEVNKPDPQKPGEYIKVNVGFRPTSPGQVGEYKLPSGFSDLYRCVLAGKQRKVQTQPLKDYPAKTSIDAPDNCEPNWEALWSRWDARHGEKQ